MTILPEICSYYCLENLELFVTISSAIRKKVKQKQKCEQWSDCQQKREHFYLCSR